jgi:hypothetical protein
MGPTNAATIKAKLRELRTQVADRSHDTAAPAASSASGGH